MIVTNLSLLSSTLLYANLFLAKQRIRISVVTRILLKNNRKTASNSEFHICCYFFVRISTKATREETRDEVK